MKRVEVKLSLPVVEPLLDVIKAASDSLKRQLAVGPVMPDLEMEFRTTWTEELLSSQNEDTRVLLALFDSEFFSTGIVRFDEDNAEHLVRACTSIRLKMRAGALAGLDDDKLESGEIEIDPLEEPVRRNYKSYLFLAMFQELIIQHMDSSIIES